MGEGREGEMWWDGGEGQRGGTEGRDGGRDGGEGWRGGMEERGAMEGERIVRVSMISPTGRPYHASNVCL